MVFTEFEKNNQQKFKVQKTLFLKEESEVTSHYRIKNYDIKSERKFL